MRKAIALALTVAIGAPVFSAEREPSAADFKQDFEYAWREIAATYAYFDAKATSWSAMRELYGRDLQRIKTSEEFIGLFEHVVDELYDPHAQLTVNTATSPRLVPSGADLWAEWREGMAVIVQVRDNSDAQRAGIEPGSFVVAIDNQDISAVVEARLGRSYPHSVTAARDWALRSVLAGRHNTPRVLKLRKGTAERVVELPARDQFGEATVAPVSHSEIRPGIGYIRLNDSLGNSDTIAAFDRALGDLSKTRALIIDLRNTASGGNSTVARGILGRFVTREQPYQKHVLSSEERETGIGRSWIELVSPRGEFQYQRPIAVLVDHWTGSMGEGLAIGFDGATSSVLVGTPMARLVGATYTITLPHSGFGINVPAERLYHVNGTPREAFQPEVVVDVGTKDGASDPFVEAALLALGEK